MRMTSTPLHWECPKCARFNVSMVAECPCGYHPTLYPPVGHPAATRPMARRSKKLEHGLLLIVLGVGLTAGSLLLAAAAHWSQTLIFSGLIWLGVIWAIRGLLERRTRCG